VESAIAFRANTLKWLNCKLRCFNQETNMANKQNAVQGNEKIVALLNRIMESLLSG
jgi:hypothetical protein